MAWRSTLDFDAGRWTGHGTFSGDDPITARGGTVRYTGIDIVKFEAGRIVELWGNNDSQGM